MSKKQPKALRLADALEQGQYYESQPSVVYGWAYEDPTSESADELRRQHNLLNDMVDTLKKISELDPGVDTDEGYNEWGEAECFRKAKEIAKESYQKWKESK